VTENQLFPPVYNSFSPKQTRFLIRSHICHNSAVDIF
jgi:hypothetical protein